MFVCLSVYLSIQPTCVGESIKLDLKKFGDWGVGDLDLLANSRGERDLVLFVDGDFNPVLSLFILLIIVLEVIS